MKKKSVNESVKKPRTSATSRKREGYDQLVETISTINTQMVGRAAAAVNQVLVLRNWMTGAYIVEYEQNGADRAKYGARLLELLAADLVIRGIKGLGLRMLRNCRTFYLLYPQIRQPLVAEFNRLPEPSTIRQSLIAEFNLLPAPSAIRQPVVAESPTPLTPEQLARFSWTQFLEFIRIDDPWKRAFYENECLRGHWSVRQFQRQIESLLYERTGLSTNKKAVVERARKQEPQETIDDLLRDPYVLEFTGLAERPEYSENELETALLDRLQRFLLELGQGFCFEARQFRMTEGRKHYRLDLVFYNRLLRCHVLIDLKIRAFRPGDAGQMNFYLNWFKANMMTEGDIEPVGILLCSDKDGAEVEFATAGMDQKLFVSRYLTALPSAEKLRELLERDRADFISLTQRRD